MNHVKPLGHQRIGDDREDNGYPDIDDRIISDRWKGDSNDNK